MFRSSGFKIGAGVVAVLAALTLLRFQPWSRTAEEGPGAVHTGPNKTARQAVTVAYLPVTCHLTCPVTDFASKTSESGTNFNSHLYTEFPPIAEAIKAGDLKATFMIVPLAMKLREQGVPVKICYLGHRDGSTVIVRKDLPAKSLRDMKGKTMALPSPYSNQNFVIHKLMEDQGMKPGDIKFVILPPPDMPAALGNGIDGYFVGEPHAAKAELDGTGRVLHHAKDIWPGFISCALVVHEDLIKQRPEVVRDLVRGVAESGEWADRNRLKAAALVTPYFKRQDERVLRHVLTQPPDRVSYRMLNPTDKELQKIQDMGLKMGVLTKRIPISELMDRQFIPETIQAAKIGQ